MRTAVFKHTLLPLNLEAHTLRANTVITKPKESYQRVNRYSASTENQFFFQFRTEISQFRQTANCS